MFNANGQFVFCHFSFYILNMNQVYVKICVLNL